MDSSQDDDVHSNFGSFGGLFFHFPMSAKKNKNIERDQREGDHRPTAPLHVFVPQRNQHEAAPPSREIKRTNFAECREQNRAREMVFRTGAGQLVNATRALSSLRFGAFHGSSCSEDSAHWVKWGEVDT